MVAKTCDIADRSQVQSLIDDCRQNMPPIRGVIHGAMALKDSLFDRMPYEDWSLNITPRVNGAWNLHNCLASTPLDFFVMLASGSGITGLGGQTAYAASNTFLDAFAAYRQSLGLPASTIDIGIVQSVGYVAENIETRTEIKNAAHDSLTEPEFLALVKAAIQHPMSPDYQQTVTGCKLSPGIPLPAWATSAIFAHVLHALQSQSPEAAGSSEGAVSARQLLKAVSSLAAATDIIVTALVQKLSSLLALSAEDIDIKKPIVAYGLDSLVAVELRNWIAVDLEANVPLMELMNSPSVTQLGEMLAARSKLVDKAKLELDGDAQDKE